MLRAEFLWALSTMALMAQHPWTSGELVFPSDRLEIGSERGAAAHRLLGASPALVLSRDGEWTRVLGANGVAGWVRNLAGQAAPAEVHAVEMFSLSPDDFAFAGEAEPTAVAESEKISIVGASRSIRVASLDQLMLPEGSIPFLTPWLKLQAGARTGWQAPSRVTLNYQTPMEGLIRAPFLFPALPRLRDWKPAAGETVWRFANLRAKAENAQAEAANFGDAELLLHLPAKAGEAITDLAVFPGKAERLLVFQAGSTRIQAVVGSYAATITGFASADLDHDGKDELLLEFTQTNGDGWFTTLWIVDGKSPTRDLKVVAIPLGGAGGEAGASKEEAWWWVEEGKLWIVRNGKGWSASLSNYKDGAVVPQDGGVFGAVMSRGGSEIAARRAAWAEQKRLHRPVQVFRDIRQRGAETWLTICLFERRHDADRLRSVEVISFPR